MRALLTLTFDRLVLGNTKRFGIECRAEFSLFWPSVNSSAFRILAEIFAVSAFSVLRPPQIAALPGFGG
jgi:hypothetical protein